MYPEPYSHTAYDSIGCCLLSRVLVPEEVCWAKKAKYKLRRGQALSHGKFPNFFTSLERFFAIKKKSILDLSLRDFDSYVNLPSFGWRIL